MVLELKILVLIFLHISYSNNLEWRWENNLSQKEKLNALRKFSAMLPYGEKVVELLL